MDIDFKVEHIFRQAEPLHVTVERGQRGGYGWTIKVYEADLNKALDRIRLADRKLKELFLIEEEKATDESKEHTD